MSAVSDFERRVRAALDRSGFTSGRQAPTCVVHADGSSWTAHAEATSALLTGAELQRAARLRGAREREAYVLAHALWRIVLAAALQLPCERVVLHHSPQGQPLLPGTGLSTSLSHSGHDVAIAVSQGPCVGVDIERCPARYPMDDLLAAFCSAAEQAHLATLPAPQRQREALQLWTRKEALLKAWGTGLLLDPCAVELATDRPIGPTALANVAPCRVHDLAPRTGLLGAVATALPDDRPASFVIMPS